MTVEGKEEHQQHLMAYSPLTQRFSPGCACRASSGGLQATRTEHHLEGRSAGFRALYDTRNLYPWTARYFEPNQQCITSS